MIKRTVLGFLNGFCYSIAITVLIHSFVSGFSGHTPMLPEYIERFDSELTAYICQLLMIGLMSGITSAGTAIFETKRIGLLVQSLLFLIIMLCAWIPVACIAWGFHRYAASMIVTVCSIVVTYAICWVLQYKLCRREIDEINGILDRERE